MVIYKFTFPNGKSYVGRTVQSPEIRWASHRYKSKTGKLLVHRAIRKYGWDKIQKEILYEGISEEDLIIKEKVYIDLYNSIENGYNINENTERGGNNWKGRKDTQEYKDFVQKMRVINLGENNGMYGKEHSEESKLLLKQKAIGRYSLDWFKERYGEEQGLQKYKDRSQNRSTNMKGKDNPSYKDINIADLEKTIMTTNMNLKQLEERYGVTSTVLYRRFKQLYNCQNLNEVRQHLSKVV